MRRRVPQPPVQPALRDPERHDFWPGLVAAVIGVFLLMAGARHLTGVETVSGDTARETQLIRAFASGGVQYASRLAPPPPPQLDDPAAAAEALERWALQNANSAAPTWKVRVDTESKAACPT